MTEPVLPFGALVGLMVLGTGVEDSIDGIVRRIEGPDEPESRVRVRRRGDLIRREAEDGTMETIEGETASWWTSGSDQVVSGYTALNQHRRAPIGGLDVGGHRPSFERWEGTDFTRPTGPVILTSFLGRPAWFVELAPPGHKPHPLQLTVDAATGLIVRKTNIAFGTLQEWVTLDVGADLPDELFSWNGPAIDEAVRRAERQAEHERDMVQRTQWLTSRGIVGLPLSLSGEVQLHDWDDDTGALYASVNFRGFGTLIRRAASTEPWDEPETANAPYRYRWTDGHWDWFYASDTELSEDQLGALKDALSGTT